MPELTSVMARSPAEASRTSTIRSTPPSPPRTMRPKSVPMASVRSKVRTVAAAPASACVARSAWRLAGIGQRMVGVEHEHVAVEALERSARGADGVAGPERPLLRHRLDPGRQPRADRLGAGGHDNEHPVGLRLEARGDRPVDQRAPEDLVQHLRRRGAHAGALTGGEENTGEWRAVSHAGSGRSVLGAGAPGFEPGITGPKPVALPLGHAPSSAVARGRIEYTSGGAQVDFEPKPVPPAARRALRVVVARDAEPGRVLRDDREHGEVGAAGRAGNGDLAATAAAVRRP